jgi:hypothetical protein
MVSVPELIHVGSAHSGILNWVSFTSHAWRFVGIERNVYIRALATLRLA